MSDAVSLRTPKYRHHKAKNLAVVTIRGRDIYLGKYGSSESQQEYRRLVAEYIHSGGVVQDSNLRPRGELPRTVFGTGRFQYHDLKVL